MKRQPQTLKKLVRTTVKSILGHFISGPLVRLLQLWFCLLSSLSEISYIDGLVLLDQDTCVEFFTPRCEKPAGLKEADQKETVGLLGGNF